MNKLIERAALVASSIAQAFHIPISSKLEDEGKPDETLYIDSWLSLRVENRRVPGLPDEREYPHLILEVAVYSGGSWDSPPDVDVSEVLATMQPAKAGQALANFLIDQIITGTLEGVLMRFEAEDEPTREQVWDCLHHATVQ